MTELQLPDWMSNMTTKEKNKILKLCDKTVLCVASETRAPLTENEVVTALEIRRAVVLRDGQTSRYWVRGSDDGSNLFLQRIHERGLPGFALRSIDRHTKEWDRLARKLSGRTELEDDSGPSPPENSVEQQLDIPPTPHPTQSGVAENLGPGNGEASTTSLHVGEQRPVTDSGSSRTLRPRIAGGSGGGHTSADRVSDRRPRKKRRCDKKVSQQASVSSPTSDLKQKEPPPPMYIRLGKLPPEVIIYIFQLCLEGATSSQEYNDILEKLALNEDEHCLQVLQGYAAFWTWITSTSPEAHIKSALDFSKPCPLHIEGGPTRDRGAAFNRSKIVRFLSCVEPHRDRWASLALLFPSSVFKMVKKHLSGPAPTLETLSLCMADASPLRSRSSRTEETSLPLDILGGEAGNLQRVFFNNVPCLWDPSPFTEIRELGLTNGVQLRFMETITFFRHSSNLSALRLVNIKFVGDAPHVVEETAVLPRLTELVFAELIERSGLGFLWLSLDTPACSKLHLDLRPSEAIVRHAALPSRAAPTIQKALTPTSKSLLRFGCNIDTNTQYSSWTSRDEDGPEQNEPQASFEIAFRGLGSAVARFFCDFVRGVQESVGDVGDIVVSVADSFSGAIDPPLDVELDELVPILFPDSFRGLNVVEVRADIVDDYLELLLEMMAPPEPQVWWLDGLKTISLYAIPKDELALEPHPTVRRSLEDFIQIISKHHYGMVLGVGEPKPIGKRSLSLLLEGDFSVSTSMTQALEKEKKWWGVTIDDTDAVLTDGEVQKKRTEEEAEGVNGEVEEEIEEAGFGSD